MANLLRIENWSVGFGPREVLKNISASLSSPELVVIMGLNGSGKTTLMKSLGGFIPVQKGKISIGNESVSDLSPQQLAQKMAVVFTSMEGANDLKVHEFVALGRSPYLSWSGKLTEQDELAIQEAIESVGLAGFEQRLVATLSDGEKKRANIARALAQDTPIILLDEPSSHLDIKGKKMLFDLLSELKQHKLLIVISHEWELSKQHANRIWLLEKGQLLEYPQNEINDSIVDKHFGLES